MITANAIRQPLIVWAIHWLIVQTTATLAYLHGTSRADQGTYVFRDQVVQGGASAAYQTSPQLLPRDLEGIAHWLVEPFRLWDGTWYRLVAWLDYGRDYSATAAFFPLYPYMMRWGHELTGLSYETVGYIVSNLAFLFGLIMLYRLVSLDFNDTIARRTLWSLALFPTSFFFSAVYTESLFFLLSVSTLYAARRGQWLGAGIGGLCAALTRNSGILLLAPMGVLFLSQHGWNPRRWFPHVVPAGLPALGPVIYGSFLIRADMSFFAWADQQWQWNRFSATPWRTLDCTLNGCTANVRSFGSAREMLVNPIDWGWIASMLRSPTWSTVTSFEWRDRAARGDVLELLVTVAAFAILIVGLRKVPLYYSAFALLPLIVPLFSPSQVHPLMSLPRFVLPIFPLFVVIALLIPNRRIGLTLALASSLGLVLLTMQFALWYWVS